jgi:bifunctional UDP-N-acetylglucosamine pyrophosphorylase / glucosamine-1-phosphate N-acetyltransferase
MAPRTCLTVVLAAGEGTRMKSALPKVLHQAAGRSLVGHTVLAAREAGANRLAVVVGPDRNDVAEEVRSFNPDAQIFVQKERQGTAHAVLQARGALQQPADDIIILFADTPLVSPATLMQLRTALADGAAVAVTGFYPHDPEGYGRLVIDDGELVAIREDRDATLGERKIGFCNAGLMALAGSTALELLDGVSNANAKREFYLTDVVSLARAAGLKTVAIVAEEEEVQGVNTRAQLSAVEHVLQRKLRAAAMASGVTLVAPDTVFISADTKFGQDITVEPNVFFGPGVTVENGATVRAFCHLEGAHVGKNVTIGPFARLRPGASLGANTRIGNFVEIKNAVLDNDVKVNHLAYVGDAHVGADANIGAGAITCNYDGTQKHHTEIGAGAFVGVNSALVAPVTVGEGAYIGTGSVITKDVPADALAVARARQVVKPGWAKARRQSNPKKKHD